MTQGPALSSSLHPAESGSSSAPFPRRLILFYHPLAWLSTARAISMQPTATYKLFINSLRMEPALFSLGRAPSPPAHIPLALLLTAAVTCSFPPTVFATPEATQFSNSL